jgi:hypothetical protein
MIPPYRSNAKEIARAAIAIADQTYAQGIDERDRLLVALEGIETLIPGFEARINVARSAPYPTMIPFLHRCTLW